MSNKTFPADTIGDAATIIAAEDGTVQRSGNITALNESVILQLAGQGSFAVDITNTWVGTLAFQGTLDNVNWFAITTTASAFAPGSTQALTATANATRVGMCTGFAAVRVTATAWTSGTASVLIRAIPGGGAVSTLAMASTQVDGRAGRGVAQSGNPVVIGMRGATAAPTAVSNAQVVDLLATVYGVAITRPWSIPELCWSFACAAGGIVNTTDVPIAAAAGAGLRRYINRMTISNNSATATEFVVKDGASTVLARFQLPANAPNFPVAFDPPLAGTANTAMNVACLTTAAAVFCNAQGFTAP